MAFGYKASVCSLHQRLCIACAKASLYLLLNDNGWILGAGAIATLCFPSFLRDFNWQSELWLVFCLILLSLSSFNNCMTFGLWVDTCTGNAKGANLALSVSALSRTLSVWGGGMHKAFYRGFWRHAPQEKILHRSFILFLLQAER